MTLPNNIQNGDVPDANVLMNNFSYLADGKGLKVDTYVALKIFAALAPGAPFLCVATDLKQLMAYLGDPAIGDGGFIPLGGGAISSTEVG